MAKGVQKKISSVNGAFLLLAAICFDVFSFIPIINIVTDFGALMVFTVWFYLSGASFTKNKKMIGVSAVTFLIEVIPFVSMLPAWTFNIIFNIVTINRQAKKEQTEMQTAVSNANKQSAFARLRDQRTHTGDEINRLNRAREVMRTGLMRPGENRDPVIMSAMEEFKKRKRKEEIMQEGQISNEALVQKSAIQKDEERKSELGQESVDAYQALDTKVDRTVEEQETLGRAEQIRMNGMMKMGEYENPVFLAAYERYLKSAKSNQNLTKENPDLYNETA